MKISVLIATKDRPEQLIQCLKTLYKSTHQNFEVIVVDQSATDEGKRIINVFPTVRYFRYRTGGKSGALNFGSTKANGSLLVFTDDDCLVTPGWLSEMEAAFRRHSLVQGVFGSTYPYNPQKHRGQLCPSTYVQSRSYAITKPGYHVSSIGFGNNMAIRKKTFIAIGGFARWLGPGTLAMAAEDAEIESRLLLNGYMLWYQKTAKIYHNKWLSPQKARRDDLHYLVGETACYGNLLLNGHSYAKTILRRAWTRDLRQFVRYGLQTTIHPNRKNLGSVWWSVLRIAARSWGFLFSIGLHAGNI